MGRGNLSISVVLAAALAIALVVSSAGPVWAGGGAGKSIQVMNIYQSGGATLTAGDAAKLARYYMFFFNRSRYYQISPDTYTAVRALNPDTLIFNYQQGPDTWLNQDGSNVLNVNNIVRYNNTYGHSMGNLNTDNPAFFLLNSSAQRIYTYGDSNRRLLDFGSADFQAYWLEATEADIVDQEWCPDGIFVDNCMPTWASYFCQRPAIYPTDAQWTPAMISFHTALAAGLHARGLKLWTNTDHVHQAAGYAAWLAIDADPNHPDWLNSEGSFCHGWGGACTFYDETRWKRQVDIMVNMVNCGAGVFSHVNMPEGGSGVDNYAKPVTYWDALWYAMGSYLLGKNEVRGNDVFYFSTKWDGYTRLYWYDEYHRIDLGEALGNYVLTVYGGRNIYWRQFEKGYVYVNPTGGDCASIPLPEACKQLSHATINDDPIMFPDVTNISLASHRAAILLNTSSLIGVAGRHVFYNQSAFDGNDAGLGAADDAAIATDKSALLPGQMATFGNYTSYSRGINGIMVDIANFAGAPTAADFVFRVGNSQDPSSWTAAPAPINDIAADIRPGAGVNGSDRVTVIWADNAIAKQWLEVTVKATPNTGLAEDTVFYFGNAIGETGNSPSDANVTPTDVVGVRNNPHTLTQNPAGIDDAYDFNRDRKVGPTDAILCRNNGTAGPTALQLIDLFENQAPTVDAGSDDSITWPTNTVSLDGTVSDDGHPIPPASVTTTWSKVSGPGTVTFANASAVDTTATFSTTGVYVLQLEASDGQYTVSDTVEVRAVDPSGILFEDNFNDNDISDWTVITGTGWAAGGGEALKLADDESMAAITKGGFSVSSGTVSLQFDLTVAGDWRPGNAGLVDAAGRGIYLDTQVGDTYVQIGARNTTDNALTGTGGSVVDAPADASVGITIRYEVNLDTGQVKGYIDGDLEHTATVDLSGVGPITNVVLQAKKHWHLDNVVLRSE